MGLAFFIPDALSLGRPFNAWTGTLSGSCVNRLCALMQDWPSEPTSPAFYHGTLEYLCPACHHGNRETLDKEGCTTCTYCRQRWSIGVILWHVHTNKSRHLRTPLDWIVNLELDAPVPQAPR